MAKTMKIVNLRGLTRMVLSQLVNRLRKDSAGLKILKKYGKTFKSKD